jgi:hypothetical protein
MITAAKIIGTQVKQADYKKQTAKKGDPAYIMSRSDICDFAECPHKWRFGPERTTTDAMEWGTLIDELVLTDGKSEHPFAIAPKTYTDDKGNVKPWNWNANVCKVWAQEREGQMIVNSATFEAAKLAAKLFREDPTVGPLLKASVFQMNIAAKWKAANGLLIPIEALIDIVPAKDSDYRMWLGDLKTTNNATTKAWRRRVFDDGLYVQSALYTDLFNAATGEERNTFVHPVQEKDEPYEVVRRMMDETWNEMGRALYVKVLNEYAVSVKSNEWPGYDNGEQSIRGWTPCSPEPWMITTNAR